MTFFVGFLVGALIIIAAGIVLKSAVPAKVSYGNTTGVAISNEQNGEWLAPSQPNDTNGKNPSDTPKAFILKRKYIVLTSAAVAIVLICWVIIANLFTDERVAINKAKERLEIEVKDSGASLASIYNVKAQLVQKEDKDLRQGGRYVITGGFEFKPPGEQKSGYRFFKVYVDFYDKKFQASSPTYETDYSKK